MRGNWIEATSDTGGAGALTLSNVAGAPNFNHVFGSSGVRLVEYTIIEFTDGTRTEIALAEAGVGSINLSTMVLTRSAPKATWNGSAYVATSPSALNFGNTAANIRILCAPLADTFMGLPFPVQTAIGDGVGSPPMGYSSVGNASFVLGNGRAVYVPAFFNFRHAIDNCSLRVVGGYNGGTSSIHVAIYQFGTDGLPGAKLVDFGDLGSLSANTTLTSGDLSTPVMLPPDWYFVALLPQFSGGSGTPSIRGATMGTPYAFGMQLSQASLIAVPAAIVDSQASLDDPATLTGLAVVSVNNSIVPIVSFDGA